jgi:DNA-directed RNA polymerase subunit RPC12/RpoP
VTAEYCSVCGGRLAQDGAFCPHCGARVVVSAIPSEDTPRTGAPPPKSSPSPGRSAGSEEDSVGTRPLYCPECGSPVPDEWPTPGADHCEGCGIPLGEEAWRDDIQRVNREYRGLGIVSLILAILGLVAFLWALETAANSSAGAVSGLTFLLGIVIAILFWSVALVFNLTRRSRARVELQQLGVWSPVAVALASSGVFDTVLVAQISSAISSGRLEMRDPVAAHPPSRGPDAATDAEAREDLYRKTRLITMGGGGSTSHAARNIGIVIAVIVIVVLVLYLVPLPQSFSTTLDSSVVTPTGSELTFPQGSQVSGSWQTGDGGSVTLVILNGSGHDVYTADAVSGTFTFSANDPPYVVTAVSLLPETVSISGTFWAPIL